MLSWASILYGAALSAVVAGAALTGIGVACFGAALLASGRLARWLGWTFVASGLLVAISVIVFGDGPPEAVELPLLLGGILPLRPDQTISAGHPPPSSPPPTRTGRIHASP